MLRLISGLSIVPMLGLLGCSKPAAPSPYKLDVDRICHAIEHSGSEGLDQQSQSIQVAQWLGANLQTDQGRSLSIELTKLDLEARKTRLSEEATKLGIQHCSLYEDIENATKN